MSGKPDSARHVTAPLSICGAAHDAANPALGKSPRNPKARLTFASGVPPEDVPGLAGVALTLASSNSGEFHVLKGQDT
ncbi:hypothetical protein PG997_014275 [Apiospora hydei]|uniref:DUF397 domain-containing protein n=1 Tax=Apiospora hydei TaxID=1337664 RepID=A0ABR1UWI7_9PEZI